MSQTTNLKLFKHDNPSTNENQFDVESALNENWDKIDTGYGNLNTNKVDKVEGKGLSTEDYTTAEKQKLAGLSNYDDTEIKEDIQELQTDISDIKKEQTTQNDLLQRTQSALINITTPKSSNINVKDSSDLNAKVDVYGISEQDGEPSPSNIVDIENVTGNINIKIYNKNLLDLTKCGFSNCVKNEDGSVRSNINNNYYATITTSQLNDFILQNKGKSLTFSFEGISTKTIGFFIPCKRANSDSDYFEARKTGNSVTMQIPEDLESLSYIQIRWNRQSTPFTDITTVINNIQLELNDVKTDFIEHKEQPITFPLAEGQKLADGDYLATDGIHHVRKQIELDGSEAFQTQAQSLDNIFYTAILIKDMKQLLKDNLLSSHFKGVLTPSVSVGISGSYANYLYFGIEVESIGALPTQTEAEKKELFKTWLAQQKQAGTPVVVEYELAEEEVEPYTEEQQEAYNKLQNVLSYKTVTNVFTDKAQLVFKYIADTKTYVDNETNTIKEQLNTINELLSTTATSATLLENLQSDLESEVT